MALCPVFPLSQMPLPGICLPLRIFERRYLDMVRRQLRAGEGFVIAEIRAGREVGSPAEVWPMAVEVAIVDYDQLPDGLLGITVQGRKVCRVVDPEAQADGLLLAQCHSVAQATAADQPLAEGAWDGLLAILQQFKSHPAIAAMALPAPATEAELGWQLLQLLPLGARERQSAMALSPAARLRWLADTIDRLAAGEQG